MDKNGKVIYSEEIRQAHERERLEREKNCYLCIPGKGPKSY